MKFKTLAILSLTGSILLSGCGSDSKDPEQVKKDAEAAGKTIYETAEFSLQLPKEWETIEKNSYPSNVPQEIIIGFRSNMKNEIFTANLNIAGKEFTEESVTTGDFAKGSLATIKKSLIGFQLLTENEKEGSEESPTVYNLEFEGRKSSSEPVIHFRQLYMTNNGFGYTLTASYLPSEDESVVNALQEMLDSFALK